MKVRRNSRPETEPHQLLLYSGRVDLDNDGSGGVVILTLAFLFRFDLGHESGASSSSGWNGERRPGSKGIIYISFGGQRTVRPAATPRVIDQRDERAVG